MGSTVGRVTIGWCGCLATLTLLCVSCTDDPRANDSGLADGGATATGGTGGMNQPTGGANGGTSGTAGPTSGTGAGFAGTNGSPPVGGMSPGFWPPPQPCASDAQCRMVAEDALRPLKETQTVERRVLHSQCLLNPCASGRSGRKNAKPFCDCILDPGDGRELEWQSLGNVGPCNVVGRGPACLMQRDDYVNCDLDDAQDCANKCETVADLLDADDARSRDIEVRHAECRDTNCVSVVRIDEACYFDQYSPPTEDGFWGYGIPTLDDQDHWDCSLSDEEIVGKYLPTPDWEGLGCTVEPGAITCETSPGQGGCTGWQCYDRACYGDAGLEYSLSGCTCPAFDPNAPDPDIDAGVEDAGP